MEIDAMKRILDRNRGYTSPANRKRAIAGLRKKGWNHFVCYKDTKSEFALQFGKAAWVQPGSVYIDR